VEAGDCVEGGPAMGVWRWAAWWLAARRRFFSLCAGPRWRGRGVGDGGYGGEGWEGGEG
jgi:hypothetical protein